MKPKELRGVLATNIRSAAAAKGVALNSLADFADVARSQLYDVLAEKKAATVDWLAKLSEALEVEPWELLKPPRDGKSSRSR